MSDEIRSRMRRETECAMRQHKDAVAEYEATRVKIRSTSESLKVALWRENTFLLNGAVLTDEQISKMRFGS